MKKNPLIVRGSNSVIIYFDGKKLIEPLSKYKDMTDKEILAQFLKERMLVK